jgi:hypothetical protein
VKSSYTDNALKIIAALICVFPVVTFCGIHILFAFNKLPDPMQPLDSTFKDLSLLVLGAASTYAFGALGTGATRSKNDTEGKV